MQPLNIHQALYYMHFLLIAIDSTCAKIYLGLELIPPHLHNNLNKKWNILHHTHTISQHVSKNDCNPVAFHHYKVQVRSPTYSKQALGVHSGTFSQARKQPPSCLKGLLSLFYCIIYKLNNALICGSDERDFATTYSRDKVLSESGEGGGRLFVSYGGELCNVGYTLTSQFLGNHARNLQLIKSMQVANCDRCLKEWNPPTHPLRHPPAHPTMLSRF